MVDPRKRKYAKKSRRVKRELFTGRKKKVYSYGDTYEGDFVNDKRCGNGKMISKDENISYEGEWRNNLFHGKGKLLKINEQIHNGNWKYGKRHGYGETEYLKEDSGGTYEEFYKGNWDNDTISGDGKYTFGNGDVYEGQWLNNKFHGFGYYRTVDGIITYNGEWFEGQKHGEGKWISDDGDIFEGIFEYNVPVNGKVIFKNKNEYVGLLQSFSVSSLLLPGGFGAMQYHNGDYYEGMWLNGYKHGLGIYYYANGDKYEGEWDKGKKRGRGIYTYKSGKVIEGEFNTDMYQNDNVEYYVRVEVNEKYTKSILIDGDHELLLDEHIQFTNKDNEPEQKICVFLDHIQQKRYLQFLIHNKIVHSFPINTCHTTAEILLFIKNIDSLEFCNERDFTNEDLNKIKCPISMDVMMTPTSLSCGHTFEKKNIYKLICGSIQEKQVCPLCREEIVNHYENSDFQNLLSRCRFKYKEKIIDHNLYDLLKHVIASEKIIVKKHDPNAWLNEVLWRD
jgi:hypothetical protein